MAIQFCTVCGDLLPISQLRAMDCECCGETNESMLFSLIFWIIHHSTLD